jgi:hypothetical protein
VFKKFLVAFLLFSYSFQICTLPGLEDANSHQSTQQSGECDAVITHCVVPLTLFVSVICMRMFCKSKTRRVRSPLPEHVGDLNKKKNE